MLLRQRWKLLDFSALGERVKLVFVVIDPAGLLVDKSVVAEPKLITETLASVMLGVRRVAHVGDQKIAQPFNRFLHRGNRLFQSAPNFAFDKPVPNRIHRCRNAFDLLVGHFLWQQFLEHFILVEPQ